MKDNKENNLKYIILLVVLIIVCIILYARFISTKGLNIKEYPIIDKNIPANFEGLKIVHFSDLLYGRTVNKDDVKKIVTKINELKPDIIVFTGDLIDKDTVYKKEVGDFLTEQLGIMEARLNKFAIAGDYDYQFKDYEIIMKNSGFTYLNNTYDLIYDNGNFPIMIAGFPSYLESKHDNNSTFSYLLEHNNENIYSIVLAHEADSFSDFKNYNVNLVLSGHSLGGQIKIPFVGSIFSKNGSKKYYNDLYEEKNTKIFISSGIGTTNYSFRFFNKPSINFYRLYKE